MGSLRMDLSHGSYSYAPRNRKHSVRVKGYGGGNMGVGPKGHLSSPTPAKLVDKHGRFGPDFEWQQCFRNVDAIESATTHSAHSLPVEPESFRLIQGLAHNKRVLTRRHHSGTVHTRRRWP